MSEFLETSVARSRGGVRPLVSVVVPAFNEAELIVDTLTMLCDHMASIEPSCAFEIIVVDDGSTDETGTLAAQFASAHQSVLVIRNRDNRGLGNALRGGFAIARGKYVAVIDCDLSYSPQHITRMLCAMQETNAQIVIASPYAKQGQVTNVPFVRRTLSRLANRLLSFTAGNGLSTVTGMVRLYDGSFLQDLDLLADDSSINTEIIYKAKILDAQIVEIPAHLDWSFERTGGHRRRSASFRMSRTTVSSVFSSFLFRPFAFFMLPGLILLAVAAYSFGWVVWHVAEVYGDPSSFGNSGFTAAIQNAYGRAPHTFLITGITFVLALQLIVLGVIAAQAKRYFEELFHLNTTMLARLNAREQDRGVEPKPDNVRS
ncbi:MAG: glycosyltransferase family 2 protein [Acidimicrobiia bacterium]|nr:glycosyltransferase family 2 protein [Acidimicrobiia bacterium]